RKALEKAPEVGDDGPHLCLLQHDLRYPHAIGRRWALPRQIVAAGARVPVEQCRGDRRVDRQERSHSCISPLILFRRTRAAPSPPFAGPYGLARSGSALKQSLISPLKLDTSYAKPPSALARTLRSPLTVVASSSAPRANLPMKRRSPEVVRARTERAVSSDTI